MYSARRVLKSLRWLIAGNQAQRRRVRQEGARIAASLFGDFPIGEDNKLWRQDAAFLAAYRRLSPGNPYSEDRKFLLRELVRATKGLPGDMAECGCFRGASAWFIASERPESTLHLFDSFAGLSPPGREDAAPADDVRSWEGGDLETSEETVRETLRGFDRVRYYKGWIPDRFAEVSDRTFSLVHIDVDLYQPTKDSLEFFYPRLVDSAILVVDDYGFTTCPGAYRAVQEVMRGKPEPVIHSPTGQGILLKRA